MLGGVLNVCFPFRIAKTSDILGMESYRKQEQVGNLSPIMEAVYFCAFEAIDKVFYIEALLKCFSCACCRFITTPDLYLKRHLGISGQFVLKPSFKSPLPP